MQCNTSQKSRYLSLKPLFLEIDDLEQSNFSIIVKFKNPKKYIPQIKLAFLVASFLI